MPCSYLQYAFRLNSGVRAHNQIQSQDSDRNLDLVRIGWANYRKKRLEVTTFQLSGLDHTQFLPLFDLTDSELREQGVVRKLATSQPGFPCRISLVDAAIGEELLLLPYRHHDVHSPYRALGPIYIRRGVTQAILALGEIPDYVTRRVISIRAYDQEHMMVAADVAPGMDVAQRLQELFTDPSISYVHLHNAKQGCFSCLASRASGA